MSVWGDELEAYSLQQLDEVGTLLFGRKTAQGMAGHFAGQTGPIPDLMNGLDKVVASRTLDQMDWANTRVLKGEIADHVDALKAEAGAKAIFVFGSADLCATLLRLGAVDEYRLFLAPVAIGAGTPLFKPDGAQKTFALAEARPFASGGVLLRYIAKPG
jgi:dihydrofolate reductase